VWAIFASLLTIVGCITPFAVVNPLQFAMWMIILIGVPCFIAEEIWGRVEYFDYEDQRLKEKQTKRWWYPGIPAGIGFIIAALYFAALIDGMIPDITIGGEIDLREISSPIDVSAIATEPGPFFKFIYFFFPPTDITGCLKGMLQWLLFALCISAYAAPEELSSWIQGEQVTKERIAGIGRTKDQAVQKRSLWGAINNLLAFTQALEIINGFIGKNKKQPQDNTRTSTTKEKTRKRG
jgi:hypothetical protein